MAEEKVRGESDKPDPDEKTGRKFREEKTAEDPAGGNHFWGSSCGGSFPCLLAKTGSRPKPCSPMWDAARTDRYLELQIVTEGDHAQRFFDPSIIDRLPDFPQFRPQEIALAQRKKKIKPKPKIKCRFLKTIAPPTIF